MMETLAPSDRVVQSVASTAPLALAGWPPPSPPPPAASRPPSSSRPALPWHLPPLGLVRAPPLRK